MVHFAKQNHEFDVDMSWIVMTCLAWKPSMSTLTIWLVISRTLAIIRDWLIYIEIGSAVGVKCLGMWWHRHGCWSPKWWVNLPGWYPLLLMMFINGLIIIRCLLKLWYLWENLCKKKKTVMWFWRSPDVVFQPPTGPGSTSDDPPNTIPKDGECTIRRGKAPISMGNTWIFAVNK